MPALSDDEIKARIADGSIFAISPDTNVFDRYGCNLDFVVLKKLDQFKNGATPVLFSQIVASEIITHIAKKAEETRRDLKKALKAYGSRWKSIDVAAAEQNLALSNDPNALADSQFKAYLDAIDGTVVPAGDEARITDEVLRRYFTIQAPFEDGEKKKHEFPDAFALLSLEKVASTRGRLLLCISADGGWQEFAAQSDHLVCVADLNVALSLFHDTGRNTAEQAMAMWADGEAEDMNSEIELTIQARLDDTDFFPDASSPIEFESEPISAALQSVDRDSATPPIVVAVDDESVTFTTTVSFKAEYEASFDFYVKDSIDKDYVSLGSESATVEAEETVQLAITVLREMDPAPQATEVQANKQKYFEVNFGHVEPFADENPYDERY